MSFTIKDLMEANKDLATIEIKGKDYVAVNARITAFRKLCPMGTIKTELLSDSDGRCVFKAEVWENDLLLATGHAYEKESSSFINKTSYIENCETSAIGRALGMLGIGVADSVASAEEVNNAILNQGISKKEQTILKKIWIDHGGTEENLLEHCKVKSVEEITSAQFANVMEQIRKRDEKDGK